MVLITLGAFLGGCQSTGGPYNVRNFGAIGDGQAVDTPAINRAIDAASNAGGGTVQLPAGTYLCYSIHLKSNITLYLDQGATILAAGTPEEGAYDPAEPNPYDHYQDFGHTHWHNSLIWGEDVHDVAIEGPGLIWGKGLSRGSPSSRPTTFPSFVPATVPVALPPGFSGPRPVFEGNPDNQDDRAWPTATPPGSTEPQYPSARDTLKAGVGNKVISLKNSHNVILRDFSILHGGHFGILVTAVDNLTIDNLKIDTNRDGMDIDCCKSVRITDCTVNSPWDDAIVLKSSFGLGTTRPCQNVTISGCAVSGGYVEGTVIDGTFQKIGRWYTGSNLGTSPPPATQPAAPPIVGGFGGFTGVTSRPFGAPGRTGRIKFGTESNGGFINIAITNCTFDDCQGLAIESVDGALIEDVSISNLTMRDIVSVPIFIRLGDRARGPNQPPVGDIKRVNISNVVCEDLASKFACIISGIPGHPIQDLSISNVRIQYPGGGVADSANIEPPEREKGYPEPTMFFGMPSWGFFIRHVDGLEMSNLNLQCTTDDQRPVFQMEDVQHANVHDVTAVPAAGSSNFVLKNVTDFRATRVKGMADAQRDHVDEERF